MQVLSLPISFPARQLLPVVTRGGGVGTFNFNGFDVFSVFPESATIPSQKEFEVGQQPACAAALVFPNATYLTF